MAAATRAASEMVTRWCASYFSWRPRRIATVSSTDGSPTKICWNRRSRAGSFSIRSRYSSSVVAPIIRSSPRASIGLSMLPASIAESPPAPAPTTVCNSSMNVITWPSESLISWSTAFNRSSNSPRYFAPATIAARSRERTRRPFSDSGTSLSTTRWASPSTTAVLPTPGSPIRTGLFLVRRDRTCTTRRISASRPMTGSSWPCSARAVRSTAYFSSAWYVDSGSRLVTLPEPRTLVIAPRSASSETLELSSACLAVLSTVASASSRCSVETNSSSISMASSSAMVKTCSTAREYDGAATVVPDAVGNLSSSTCTACATTRGCTPVASMSGRAIPSGAVIRAANRCAASSCALPAADALLMAVLMTSWLRVVNFDASTLDAPPCAVGSRDSATPHGDGLAGGRGGGSENGKVRGGYWLGSLLERPAVGELGEAQLLLEFGDPHPEHGDPALEVQDAAHTFEADAGRGQLGHLPQHLDVVPGVAASATSGSAWSGRAAPE